LNTYFGCLHSTRLLVSPFSPYLLLSFLTDDLPQLLFSITHPIIMSSYQPAIPPSALKPSQHPGLVMTKMAGGTSNASASSASAQGSVQVQARHPWAAAEGPLYTPKADSPAVLKRGMFTL
jgi:hypothetical protein